MVAGLAIVVGIGLISACSSMEPYEYQSEGDEMKSGPGLITGEDGEAVIFRIPDKSKDQKEEPQAADTNKEAPESERMIQP